jgi:hypothetical protein
MGAPRLAITKLHQRKFCDLDVWSTGWGTDWSTQERRLGYELVHWVPILGVCEVSKPGRLTPPKTPHDRLGVIRRAGRSSPRKRATCCPGARATFGLGLGQRLLDRVADMDTPDLHREPEPVDSAGPPSTTDLGEGHRPSRRGNRSPRPGDRAVSPGRREDDGSLRRCVVPPTDAVPYGVKQSAALDASPGTSGKVDVVVPPSPPQLTPGAARAPLRILIKAARGCTGLKR